MDINPIIWINMYYIFSSCHHDTILTRIGDTSVLFMFNNAYLVRTPRMIPDTLSKNIYAVV